MRTVSQQGRPFSYNLLTFNTSVRVDIDNRNLPYQTRLPLTQLNHLDINVTKERIYDRTGKLPANIFRA